MNEILEDKNIIFKTFGSNPILLDQKLRFQLRNPFFQYKKGIKQAKEELKRFEPKNGLTNQTNLNFSQKSSLWCGREDLNLHTFRHSHLKTACIPISPRPHVSL